MFQNYNSASDPSKGPERLKQLRAAMAQDDLTGFIVPLADAHQGEYVAPCDARLKWLTGFAGSAGNAVILPDEAAVFVDGRYTVQVRHQVDLTHFTPVRWPATQIWDWLNARAVSGRIGFDPWLHSVNEIKALRAGLARDGAQLVAHDNLIDRIWSDQPARPAHPIRIHPDAVAGRSAADKRRALADDLREYGHVAAVITLTDSICWLLNIRGSDIPRNPIVQAFAVLYDDERVDLFTDAPASDELRVHLGPNVALHPRGAFLDTLKTIQGAVRIDPISAPVSVESALAQPVQGADPCILPKACKNPVEIAGARAAHLRDGAAMVRFLHWLDTAIPQGTDEIAAAKALEGFRAETGQLLDISFETISSTGPNGAINHYRVSDESNRPLRDGDLFLIDSGGQYLDGTTDITRTVPVGTASDLHRACYTRVLRGLITLSMARFPHGVSGAHLDALARFPLWMAGQDFDHGTGHGVGSYLCVHEGPQRISGASTVRLEPGMILSNEPGYYREDAFGIRLENLIVVQEAPPVAGQDDRSWLSFETLAFVPFDKRLIDIPALLPVERSWLNAYHAQTLAAIGPQLEGAALSWLEHACAAL